MVPGKETLRTIDYHNTSPVGVFSTRSEFMRSRRRPKRWIPVLILLLIAMIGVASFSYYKGQIDGSPSGAKVSVSANPGEGLAQFSSALSSKHVIGSSLIFKLWLRTKSSVILQAGTYGFRQHEPFANVLSVIAKGPILDTLSIPDGLTLAQVASKVAKLPGHSAAHFLAVANSGQVRSPFQPASTTSLEGLLYPDTYRFGPSTSDKTILQMMVNAFVTHVKKYGLTPATRLDGMSSYQVITMASIIEKEAIYPGDGNRVARVILNRLSAGMKLQLDSTVFYALNSTAAYLSLSDLNVASAYNTYLHPGLPPTPISIPSMNSIQDAMHPASGNWLYYVVTQPNGAESFSSTYAGQLANERLASQRGLG